MHSSRMRTARSLILSRRIPHMPLPLCHICPPSPCTLPLCHVHPPLPCPLCHTCPLRHACLPSPCMPPFTTQAPFTTHTPGNHACPQQPRTPLATTPPVDRQTPVKIQPSQTSFAGGKNQYMKYRSVLLTRTASHFDRSIDR